MTKAKAPAHESLFEYVLNELEASKGKWSAVAEGSGVSYRTLEKIARGEIKDPGISHVEKLAKYFRDQAAA
jgi:transcriptional regulator with XRE-family HTH domain